MNHKDAIWLIGLGFGLIALWLDYKTLNFASLATLNIRQDTKRLLKAIILSLLFNALIIVLMPAEYTVERLVHFNSPYWLHFLIVPTIIYRYVLRNQSGHRLNVIETLGLCSIKLILFVLALLMLCIPTFFLFLMFDDSS